MPNYIKDNLLIIDTVGIREAAKSKVDGVYGIVVRRDEGMMQYDYGSSEENMRDRNAMFDLIWQELTEEVHTPSTA